MGISTSDLNHEWTLNAGLILAICIHVSDLCPLKELFKLSYLITEISVIQTVISLMTEITLSSIASKSLCVPQPLDNCCPKGGT